MTTITATPDEVTTLVETIRRQGDTGVVVVVVNPPEPLAYNVQDAARMLGVTPNVVWRLIRSGGLTARRDGRKVVMITREDLVAYLASRAPAVTPAAPVETPATRDRRRFLAEIRNGGRAQRGRVA